MEYKCATWQPPAEEQEKASNRAVRTHKKHGSTNLDNPSTKNEMNTTSCTFSNLARTSRQGQVKKQKTAAEWKQKKRRGPKIHLDNVFGEGKKRRDTSLAFVGARKRNRERERERNKGRVQHGRCRL